MSDLRFEIHPDWCESDLHCGERLPTECVRIGGIWICEHCLYRYVDRWDDALHEAITVEEQRRDLIHAVSCATRLVLGVEDA